MSHYVSNHHLSKSNQSFINQLSIISIPNSVKKALAKPRWKATIYESNPSGKIKPPCTKKETNWLSLDLHCDIQR